MSIWGIVKSALGPIGAVVEGWQKRITARQDSKLRLEEAKTDAKIARLQSAQDHEQAWERLALDKAGWKDEYLLVLFSIPLGMCFVPGLDGYVRDGFDVLREATPDWYRYSIGVMVSASFGVRSVVKTFEKGKGK